MLLVTCRSTAMMEIRLLLLVFPLSESDGVFIIFFFWGWGYRREAVQVRVRRLRPALRQQFGPQEALARAHVGQAVQLQGPRLRQVVHPPVVAAQAHEGPSSFFFLLDVDQYPSDLISISVYMFEKMLLTWFFHSRLGYCDVMNHIDLPVT